MERTAVDEEKEEEEEISLAKAGAWDLFISRRRQSEFLLSVLLRPVLLPAADPSRRLTSCCVVLPFT